MGDPKKIRKKYTTPSHPWQKKRIEEEKEIKKDYSLKNKKEMWKMQSILTNFSEQVKHITASRTKQSEIEEKQLFDRLVLLGLLDKSAVIDNVLELTLEDILKRRLQTLVFKKGFARTQKQARQFIVHGHIQINGKKVKTPSYLVKTSEESGITFVGNSSLSDEMHPERENKEKTQVKKKVKAVEEKIEDVVEEKDPKIEEEEVKNGER